MSISTYTTAHRHPDAESYNFTFVHEIPTENFPSEATLHALVVTQGYSLHASYIRGDLLSTRDPDGYLDLVKGLLHSKRSLNPRIDNSHFLQDHPFIYSFQTRNDISLTYFYSTRSGEVAPSQPEGDFTSVNQVLFKNGSGLFGRLKTLWYSIEPGIGQHSWARY